MTIASKLAYSEGENNWTFGYFESIGLCALGIGRIDQNAQKAEIMYDVVVVGAGIAGLSAAQVLAQAGLSVCVLEKSRGLGGRLATRRVQTAYGEVRVDHGAQYFTCRSPAFEELLKPLIAQGTVTPWLEAIPTLTLEGILPADPDHTYPRYCCPQGMNTLAKKMAQGLTIQRQTKVSGLTLTADNRWQVITESGHFRAGALLLTPPPQQSLALLGSLAEEIDSLEVAEQVRFQPCLAVMAGYDPQSNLAAMPFGLRWQDTSILAWSAVDSSKRPQSPMPVMVFHSTPEFAHSYAPEQAQSLIRQVLDQATQQLHPHLQVDLRQAEWAQAHYWRYSQPINPLEQQWLGQAVPAPLVLSGCWCNCWTGGGGLSGRAGSRQSPEGLDVILVPTNPIAKILSLTPKAMLSP